MKNRILAIMLVLPLLIAFAAMGFTKLISLTIPQLAEDIRLEYELNEAFEFDNFNQTMKLRGQVIPESSGEKITWASSDESIAVVDGDTLTFINEGTVTITASLENGSLKKSFTAMLVLAGDTPKYIKANLENPNEKGDAVIGLYDYSNSLEGDGKKPHTEVINCSVLPSKSPQDVVVEGLPVGEYSVDGSRVVFNPQKVGEYKVTIRSTEVTEAFTEMNIRVIDGVNVYSYEDLLRATNKSQGGTDMALRVNLESEANLGRKNSRHMGYASGDAYDYVPFESTYDTDFLHNMGKNTQLKAAIVFKSDLYGNGHTINLHDFAYPSEVYPSESNPKQMVAIPKIDPVTGESLDPFAADPLSFVTAAGLTVHGQGNAGFMINKDGVTLDNVVLKNCNNVNDLANLNYVGTVLEVVGDGVTIKNSTIQNGRTVVRSFSNEDLLIEDCILAYAREFIFKQGSNQFVHPTQSPEAYADWTKAKDWKDAEPELFDYDKLPQEAKDGDSTATIKNTSFYTSGIFCIGMDTHFGGELLYKWIGSNSQIKNLAATSYKSTLWLEGDVRFYDWKEAKNMDSSTLISGSFQGAKFTLDIYSLLKKYDSVYGGGKIIKMYKGVEYVNGAISFFGGGNNLSDVFLNGTSVKNTGGDHTGINDDQYMSISISLTDQTVFESLESAMTMAAGNGPFYFCIYRNTYDGIGINDSPFSE